MKKRTNTQAKIKVSVVIPVYNAAKYIKPCLESLLQQSLREIEIFCVDDGSEDDSMSILRSFAEADERIRLLSQANKGAGAARNLALKDARGIYLSILDADDVFAPNMLECAYHAAVRANADIVIFQHDKLDDRTGKHVVVPQFADTTKFPKQAVFTADDFSACGKSWFNSIPGWTWDKIFKREFVEENRISFQTTKIYNDMFFTYAAISSAARIAYLPRILMSQRINHIGRLSSKIQEAWPCVIESLAAVKDYIEKIGCYEKWQVYFSNYALRMLLYTYERLVGEEKSQAGCAFRYYALKRLNLNLNDKYLTVRDDVAKASRYWLNGVEANTNPRMICAERPTRLTMEDFDLLTYAKGLLSNSCFETFKKEYDARFVHLTDESRPDVSVIVPVYNVEATLAAALESLVRQTKRKIEIICVNDGSKDLSATILEQYAHDYFNVHVLTFAENRGLMMAMKMGAFYSVGKYVTVLESDDELTLDACELMFEHARSTGADLVQGKTLVLNPNSLPTARIQAAVKLLEPYPKAIVGKDIIKKSFVDRMFPMNVCGKLYERELIQDAFLHLKDVRTFMASDSMTFFVISALAERYESIPQYVYKYNYGLGITGRTKLSWGDFEKQCSQVDILPPLKDFASGWPYIECAYAALKRRMYNEAYGRIFEYLDGEESRRRGLELLDRKIGSWDFVLLLAERFFTKQGELIDMLYRMNFLPRTQKNSIRRVGICYYHMTPGGVQRVLTYLLPMFKAMGYKVHLILEKPITESCFKLPSRVGISYLPASGACTAANIEARLHKFQDIVQEENLDMIYYHSYSSSVLLWDMLLCKKVLNIPFVVHHHTCAGFRLSWNRTTAAFAAHSKLMSFADYVITLGKADELFFRATGSRSIYMPNPIDMTKSDACCAQSENKNDDAPTVLWCARISHEKQVFDAIRIFMQVLKRVENARLVLVGGGDVKVSGELSRFVEREGLSKSVDIVGETTDVYQYFAKASVFLQTSGIEGFSMTVAEALKYKVPVVAYELPYLETLRDNPGVVQVKQNSFADAASAICSFLEDPHWAREVAEKGYCRMNELSRFDFKTAWRTVFDDLSNGSGCRMHGSDMIPLADVSMVLKMIEQCHSFGFRLAYLMGASRQAGTIVRATGEESEQKKSSRKLLLAQEEIMRLKQSESYRIGMLVTWPLRKLKKAWQSKSRHRSK